MGFENEVLSLRTWFVVSVLHELLPVGAGYVTCSSLAAIDIITGAALDADVI